MILNKYNKNKNSGGGYTTTSSSSSGYGTHTDPGSSGSGDLNRWLWGVKDDGEDIDDTMFIGGSIYVQKDSQIADHENDDGDGDDWEPTYEPYPDDDWGNIYAEGEIQAPYLYATDILYVPHPDTKEKTDIMKLIPYWKYYSEEGTYPQAVIDCTASSNSMASLGVYSNPTNTSGNKISMDVIGSGTEHEILLDSTGFYYDDCEVATKCTLEDYYTKTEADEKFQEKLNWYSETSNSAKLGANTIYIEGGTGGIHLTKGNTELLINDVVSYNGCEVATQCWVNDAIANIQTGDVDLSNYYTKSEIDEKLDGYQEKLHYYYETENAAIVDADYVFLAGGSDGVAVQTDNSKFTYNGCEVATKCDLEEIPHTWFSGVSIGAYQEIDRNDIYPSTGTVKVGDAIFSIYQAYSSTAFQFVIANVLSVSGDIITANPIVSRGG